MTFVVDLTLHLATFFPFGLGAPGRRTCWASGLQLNLRMPCGGCSGNWMCSHVARRWGRPSHLFPPSRRGARFSWWSSEACVQTGNCTSNIWLHNISNWIFKAHRYSNGDHIHIKPSNDLGVIDLNRWAPPVPGLINSLFNIRWAVFGPTPLDAKVTYLTMATLTFPWFGYYLYTHYTASID